MAVKDLTANNCLPCISWKLSDITVWSISFDRNSQIYYWKQQQQKTKKTKTKALDSTCTQIQFFTFLSSQEWLLLLLNFHNSVYWWKHPLSAYGLLWPFKACQEGYCDWLFACMHNYIFSWWLWNSPPMTIMFSYHTEGHIWFTWWYIVNTLHTITTVSWQQACHTVKIWNGSLLLGNMLDSLEQAKYNRKHTLQRLHCVYTLKYYFDI